MTTEMERSAEQQDEQPPEESWRDFMEINNPRAQRGFTTWMGASVLASTTGAGVVVSLSIGLAAAVSMDRWHSHEQRKSQQALSLPPGAK